MKKLLLAFVGIVCSGSIALATTCPGAEIIPASPSFPYIQSLVCGTTNDITSVNAPACGATSYMNGLESVYSWTPSANYINATIDYSGQSWSGIFVFAGCPTSGGTCIGSVTSSLASKTLNVSAFSAGVTYYFVFDTWPTPDSPCPGTFTLNAQFGPPVNPPAPIQAAGIPSCATGTTLEATGTPGPDVTWYWQTTNLGTSMATEYTGPYTILANGTYYLRAYNSATSLWSPGSSSVVVSNFPLAVAPPTPIADANPACVTSGSILTAASSPSGYEYYWQGTNATGSSMALPASSTYSVSTSGTYYLAAFETSSQCWSAGVGLTIVIETTIPPAPSANPSEFYYCTTAAAMPVTAILPSSGNCSVTATASGTDNTGVTATVNNFSCATGSITGATLNASIGGTCPAWYYYSIIVNGVTVATQQCNQTGFNLTPYLPLTSVSIVSADNPADGVGDFVNMSLTVNLNYLGGDGISWYDVTTGGTPFATGLTAETIGSPVMPTATEGVYSYFARTNLGACSSATSTEITVNVAPVVVTISPQNVTCNNGNDGTFAISNFACGNAPFSFSVDGGAFDVAPNNLSVGTYSVIVRDGGLNLSAPYTVTIGDAPAPSAIVVNTFNNDIVDLSWTAGGSETSWNVEWGTPGFAPGTGAELGSANALTNVNYVVSGLDGNTAYQIYISANCGSGTTPGTWSSTNVTTLCDPLVAQGFCENFASDSPTEACWTVINANGDADAWDMNYTFNPFNGNQVAALYTDFNAGNNDDWLITPGMILTGNEIMSFNYRVQSAGEPNDFEVLLSTTGTNPADFTNTLMTLNSYNNIVYQDTAINLSAFSGTCYIAFHVPPGGLDGWRLYIDQVCIDICTPAPGVDGTVDVCRLDATLDLNTVITQGENNGVWQFAPNQGAVSGSDLNITAIPNGQFTAQYIVTTACTVDTTVATFNVFPPSSAGVNGQLNVCRNQPINLLSGLTGLVDHGGTWYNPSGVALTSGSLSSGALPGQFNYNYITSNGVCPNDTATVIVNVATNCDWTGIEELNADAITVYPNPSTGLFYISNSDANQNFTYEVLDLNGRVIVATSKEVSVNSPVEVNLTNVEHGIYMIKVSNESGSKLVRVVKN